MAACSCHCGISSQRGVSRPAVIQFAKAYGSGAYVRNAFYGIAHALKAHATMKCLHNRSILLIDDDATLLRALDKVLSGAGATVTTACRGGEGIEVLRKREKRFDLIITDLQMPFVKGVDVVRAVHAFFPPQPVVVLTAFANPEIRAACLEHGAVAVLEKPIGSPGLIAAVEAALRVGATTRERNAVFPKTLTEQPAQLNPASGHPRYI
jgi:CheY-like chemotaxis protein